MVARGLQGGLQVLASDLNEKRPPSSLRVDAVARQVVESFNEMENDEESSDEVEDSDQRRNRYAYSFMSEVSDPEYWMEIHHGDQSPVNSEAG